MIDEDKQTRMRLRVPSRRSMQNDASMSPHITHHRRILAALDNRFVRIG